MIDQIINILKNGGVVACPTDTVYGLLADATNPDAVKKVFAIKGRGQEKALPIFIGSLDWLSRFVSLNETQQQLLEQVWPGKVTAVLPLKKNVALINNAFRVPNHELVSEILMAFNKPLTGTSANRSGQEPCLNAQCVRGHLNNPAPDYIIDQGVLPPSQPSTIVDLMSTPFKILREGADIEKLKLLLKN